MTGQQKKYVFRELVQNRTDALQLISYAIYKSHKDERAMYFRDTYGDALVSTKLQEWHDSIVSDSQWLDTFRKKASLLIKEIENLAVQNAMPDISLKHEKTIATIKSAHEDKVDELTQRALSAESKAREEWATTTNAWAANQTKPGWFKRNSFALLKVIGGSVISVLGGAIATGCIVGVLALTNPSLSATANSIAKGLVDKLLPADDPTGLGVKSFTNEQLPTLNEKKP